MGGYALYVWLAVAVAIAAFGLLTVHTLWARRALFRRCDASRRASGGSRPLANMTRRPRMQARRKTRLYIVLAVLAGLGLTVSLTLYALSSNIDLFYTREKLSTVKRKPGRCPIPGSACGWGYVQPGSCSATRKPSTCALSCMTPAGSWTSAIRAFCRTCSVKDRAWWPGRSGRRAAYHRSAGAGQA